VPEPVLFEVEAEGAATPIETETRMSPEMILDDDNADDVSITSDRRRRRSLAQKVKDWLGRAA
jgi:hypothetical protein